MHIRNIQVMTMNFTYPFYIDVESYRKSFIWFQMLFKSFAKDTGSLAI